MSLHAVNISLSYENAIMLYWCDNIWWHKVRCPRPFVKTGIELIARPWFGVYYCWQYDSALIIVGNRNTTIWLFINFSELKWVIADGNFRFIEPELTMSFLLYTNLIMTEYYVWLLLWKGAYFLYNYYVTLFVSCDGRSH